MLLLWWPFISKAQTDSAKSEELISPSAEFISIQKADNSIDLKAIFKAKIKGGFIKLAGLKIDFSLVSDSSSKELGSAYTDDRGVALFNCKAADVLTDKEGKMHFKASFAGDKKVEAATEEVTVKKAMLQIVPVKEDSIFSVQVKLVDISSGKEVPVPDADLGIFVTRLFNPLKVGEGKTDSSGLVSVEVPNDLPGDDKGNITLLARLDDNETYGNLEASVTQQWGIPVSDELKELPRALWSTHPPMWMLVTFVILISVVWGHYIVIIYELFRLRKEEKQAARTTSA